MPKKKKDEGPYEWIRKWGIGDDLISDEKYGEEEMPVLKERKILTLDKKVIIEAAITGWQPVRWWRERGVTNLPPGSNGGKTCIAEQVDAIVECVQAGAACIHMHPRHPKDGKARLHDAELTAEIIDRAYEQVDFIPMNHSFTQDFRKSIVWDFISGAREALKLGKGNRYVQTSLIVTLPTYTEKHGIVTDEAAAEAVRFYEANQIKPHFSCEPFYFSQLYRNLIESGVARMKPYLIALQLGKHRDDLQFADPWSYLNVISFMGLVRSCIPEKDLVLGLHPGGRNWLPSTIVGLLNGADYVRLGIEDIFFLRPHQDEIPKKVSTTVTMIRDFCEIIGRKAATATEARKIMNIKRTS